MDRKKPIWLPIEELESKYYALFSEEGFNASFVGMLFDAQLLWGKYDRTKRKVFILERTWLALIAHIKYNYLIHLRNFDSDLTFSIPCYLSRPQLVILDKESKLWVSPKELLEFHHPWLKDEKIFNESFIGQLVTKHIVRGKYDHTEGCTLVLKPSFDELMGYRNWIVDTNILFHTDDE